MLKHTFSWGDYYFCPVFAINFISPLKICIININQIYHFDRLQREWYSKLDCLRGVYFTPVHIHSLDCKQLLRCTLVETLPYALFEIMYRCRGTHAEVSRRWPIKAKHYVNTSDDRFNSAQNLWLGICWDSGALSLVAPLQKVCSVTLQTCK